MNLFSIPDLARRYTQYDMIQLHTALPEFPAYRTRLLCAFLDESPAEGNNTELYALATSLVQIGIDTHEMVSVTNKEKEKKAVRSRQLKVLAGDYFSSGFYQLLSQAGQIDMVRQLSAAICEVNRLKMSFYAAIKQLQLTAEDYVAQSVRIRSQLYVHFSQLMKGKVQRSWPQVLEGVTRCEVLADEIARCSQQEAFAGSWGYWHIMQHGSQEERKLLQTAPDQGMLAGLIQKYNVESQLLDLLEEQTNHFFQEAKQLDSERLLQELEQIGDFFLRLVRQPKVLEER